MTYKEEQLQELLTKLENSLKASPENIISFSHLSKLANIGQLTMGISHTFNNILGGILGYSQLLKSELGGNEDCVRQASVIEAAARRASKLVAQLQFHSYKNKPCISIIDPQVIVDEVVLLTTSSFPKNIKISSRCNHEGANVMVDMPSICQALLNICFNARDAMYEGGDLAIETFLDNDGKNSDEIKTECVIFRISDTGVGIPKELLTRIFQPFFTTKEDTLASGLGLTIAEGIIKSHEGDISVHPGAEKGTTFDVRLPCKQTSYVPENKSISKSIDEKEQLIMVVDDEKDLCQMAQKILEKKGYKVLLASSGKNAIEIYEEKHKSINLVILDMIMPGVDGSKVYHALRNISTKPKLIVTSGYVHNAPFQNIIDSGNVTFIPKPWDLPEFLKLTETVLSSN